MAKLTKCKYCGEEQVTPGNQFCMACKRINLTKEQQDLWDEIDNKLPEIKLRALDLINTTYRHESDLQYQSHESSTYRKSKSGETYVEKLARNLKVDMLFENAQNQKFRIKEADDHSVLFARLTKDGKRFEPNTTRRFKRIVLARMIRNRYFAITRIARREMFTELKAVGAFDLMKK